MATQANEPKEITAAELRNAVDTILSGVDLRLNRAQALWDERFTGMEERFTGLEERFAELRESVLAMRERASDDRSHYDAMFNAIHRRFDRVETRLDEIDRRRPRIGFGDGGGAAQPA